MGLAERVPFIGDEKVSDELRKVTDWLLQAEGSTAETRWNEEAAEDYKFYAGQQDTDEVLDLLEEQNRPASVFNEVKPKIDVLIGMAAQTKYQPNVVPVGREDAPLAELLAKVLAFYSGKKLKMYDKQLDAFEHMVKSGRSLLLFHIDKQNPFKPEIKVKRIPGTNFKVDPDSVEYDLSDARYVFIDKWLTEEELELFFPNIDVEAIKGHSSTSVEYPQYFNEASNKFRVVECWYRKWIPVRGFINPLTGQPEVVTEKEFRAFRKALKEGVETKQGVVKIDSLESIQTHRLQTHYMLFTDVYELESGPSPYRWKDFPCVLFGGYKDHDENRWFGAINQMKDAQVAINTMRRQLSHLLQTLPKGLMMHEVGAILNIDEYEERSADPSFHLEVAKGGIDKVKFQQQPSISPIYNEYNLIMSQVMKDASGVQDELMGFQKTSREPGVTVRTRQQASLAVLYILFYNFHKSRVQCSRILLSLIQQYVTQPEVIRIEGEEGMQLIEINTQVNPQSQGFNDISAGEYDVEVDENIENATMRLTIAQLLIDYSQNNPGTIPPDIVLEYANLPFTTKEKIRQFWQAQMELEQKNKEADRAVELAKIAKDAAVAKDKIDADKEMKREEKKNGNSND